MRSKKTNNITNSDWVKIDRDINITELITQYPDLVEVLTYDYGLHCINCIIADLDTLEQGAAIHGIEGKAFNEMLQHLEEIVNNGDE